MHLKSTFKPTLGYDAIYNRIYGLLLWVTQRQLSHFWLECWYIGVVKSLATHLSGLKTIFHSATPALNHTHTDSD